jgi:ketosteroid isomerase-like protein
MHTTANKQLVQDIFAELARSNSRPFVDAMAEDFRWIISGATAWSRTYEGKRAVVKELFGVLRATLEGKITTIAHRFVAEGDTVVVEARGRNVSKSGLPYANSYCMVFTLADGKLKELTEYMDTELALQVLGSPPTPAEAHAHA